MAQTGASHVDGVDIAPPNIKHAQAHYSIEGVSFSVGDITAFKGEEPYDVITCFETIEHVEDYRAALANLFALLKPGGKLLVSSPNRPVTSPRAKSLDDKPGNIFHIREFTVAELKADLEETGFELGDETVYGQRQRRHFTFKPARRMYNKLVNPDENASPKVTPVEGLSPRYFILVANKPS
jgi:SAM-dependent methyltransferase